MIQAIPLRILVSVFLLAWVPFLVMSHPNSVCSGSTSCDTCLSNSLCVWCPLYNSCHDFGSFLNPCYQCENYYKPTMCNCLHSPPLEDSDISLPFDNICQWYVTTHGANLPNDTSQWYGGDFLPDSYTTAANCACSGVARVLSLWQKPVAQCVRSAILQGHLALSSAIKEDVRNATRSNQSPTVPIVELIYDIHAHAYSSCGCPGTIAPFITWELVYNFAGKLLPCNEVIGIGEIWWVLEESRCGCGW